MSDRPEDLIREALRLADPDDPWDPSDDEYRAIVAVARRELDALVRQRDEPLDEVFRVESRWPTIRAALEAMPEGVPIPAALALIDQMQEAGRRIAAADAGAGRAGRRDMSADKRLVTIMVRHESVVDVGKLIDYWRKDYDDWLGGDDDTAASRDDWFRDLIHEVGLDVFTDYEGVYEVEIDDIEISKAPRAAVAGSPKEDTDA